MSGIVAGLIGGVGAFFADWVMWGKVFTGPEMQAFGTFPPTPEEGKKMMAANMPKAAVLALLFGVLFAWFYGQFRSALWVKGEACSPAWSSPRCSGYPRSSCPRLGVACGMTKFGRCSKRRLCRGSCA